MAGMIHRVLLAALAGIALLQIKGPQTPLNPYSIAEDYQRLNNVRFLNQSRDNQRSRDMDDCDRYEARLWGALGIPLRPGFGIGGEWSFCVADVEQVDWNGDANPDVLLILGGRPFQQYRYMLFLNTPGGFKYVGYVEGFPKFSDPSPTVVHFADQSFLQAVTTT